MKILRIPDRGKKGYISLYILLTAMTNYIKDVSGRISFATLKEKLAQTISDTIKNKKFKTSKVTYILIGQPDVKLTATLRCPLSKTCNTICFHKEKHKVTRYCTEKQRCPYKEKGGDCQPVKKTVRKKAK